MQEFVPFLKSAEIENAEVSGNRIKITIVASSERRDKDGDMFLKSAWAEPEDKQWYLKKGYYDYNHLTRILRMDKGTPEQIAKAELARAQAIIGYPQTLEWSERHGGRLVSEGYLHPENEFVKAIVQGLKAGNDRWGASVCGGAFRPKAGTITKYGERTWDRARLTHIAICPVAEAKNEDTAVILKSVAAALMVPQVEGSMDATVARMSDAIEPETPRKKNRIISLFGSDENFYKAVYGDLLKSIAVGELARDKGSIVEFLQEYGLTKNDCTEAADLILVKLAE